MFLLGGTAIPARGPWPDTYKYFGNPREHYGYDPDKARRLLAEAGYGPQKPLRVKVQIPTAGSGNMVPLPMGEFVQQSYKEIAVEVEYEMVDWGTMLTTMRTRQTPSGRHAWTRSTTGCQYPTRRSFF